MVQHWIHYELRCKFASCLWPCAMWRELRLCLQSWISFQEKFKLVADNLIKDATVSPSIVLSFGAAIGARVNLTLKCACFEETGVRPILHIWVVEAERCALFGTQSH